MLSHRIRKISGAIFARQYRVYYYATTVYGRELGGTCHYPILDRCLLRHSHPDVVIDHEAIVCFTPGSYIGHVTVNETP